MLTSNDAYMLTPTGGQHLVDLTSNSCTTSCGWERRSSRSSVSQW
jgi:hypothetical protein